MLDLVAKLHGQAVVMHEDGAGGAVVVAEHVQVHAMDGAAGGAHVQQVVGHAVHVGGGESGEHHVHMHGGALLLPGHAEVHLRATVAHACRAAQVEVRRCRLRQVAHAGDHTFDVGEGDGAVVRIALQPFVVGNGSALDEEAVHLHGQLQVGDAIGEQGLGAQGPWRQGLVAVDVELHSGCEHFTGAEGACAEAFGQVEAGQQQGIGGSLVKFHLVGHVLVVLLGGHIRFEMHPEEDGGILRDADAGGIEGEGVEGLHLHGGRGEVQADAVHLGHGQALRIGHQADAGDEQVEVADGQGGVALAAVLRAPGGIRDPQGVHAQHVQGHGRGGSAGRSIRRGHLPVVRHEAVEHRRAMQLDVAHVERVAQQQGQDVHPAQIDPIGMHGVAAGGVLQGAVRQGHHVEVRYGDVRIPDGSMHLAEGDAVPALFGQFGHVPQGLRGQAVLLGDEDHDGDEHHGKEGGQEEADAAHEDHVAKAMGEMRPVGNERPGVALTSRDRAMGRVAVRGRVARWNTPLEQQAVSIGRQVRSGDLGGCTDANGARACGTERAMGAGDHLPL